MNIPQALTEIEALVDVMPSAMIKLAKVLESEKIVQGENGIQIINIDDVAPLEAKCIQTFINDIYSDQYAVKYNPEVKQICVEFTSLYFLTMLEEKLLDLQYAECFFSENCQKLSSQGGQSRVFTTELVLSNSEVQKVLVKTSLQLENILRVKINNEKLQIYKILETFQEYLNVRTKNYNREVELLDVLEELGAYVNTNFGLYYEQFENEIDLQASIVSEYVVKVHKKISDLFGSLLLVSEYIEGENLLEKYIRRFENKEWVDGEKLSDNPLKAMLIFLQMAKALKECGNIVHGDVKPENYVLCEKTGKVKLIDFGNSLVPGKGFVNDKEITLTIAYCSKEVMDGEGASELSDIYALGTSMVNMLHQKIFEGEDDALGERLKFFRDNEHIFIHKSVLQKGAVFGALNKLIIQMTQTDKEKRSRSEKLLTKTRVVCILEKIIYAECILPIFKAECEHTLSQSDIAFLFVWATRNFDTLLKDILVNKENALIEFVNEGKKFFNEK